MQNVLSNLIEIQGVNGYSLFDSRGTCVDHAMPRPYEIVLVTRVLEDLRAAIEPMRYVQEGKFASFVSRFENGNVVLRELAAHTVLLLTNVSVNMAMLNVALNVASMKLERLDAAPPPAALQPLRNVHEPPSSSLKSGSLNLSASPVTGGVIPPDAVGMNVMNALWKLLAVSLGPAAKFVLKQELRHMGLHAETVRPAHFHELVGLLSAKVPDAPARNVFITAARRLVGGHV